MKRSFVLSLIVAVIALSSLVLFLHKENEAFDLIPLLVGNALLATMSLFSFSIISKGIRSDNHNAFIRAKYLAMMMKFFLGIAILLVYIFVKKDSGFHKPSIFLFLGMYVVYAALEAFPLSQSAKKS